MTTSSALSRTTFSYYDHILGVIPNNVLAPFLSGNVLSVMLIAAAVGLALAFMPRTENREALLKIIQGVQELAFTLIRAILYVLPIGIVAFAGQLSAQIEAGVIVGALGKYTAVVMPLSSAALTRFTLCARWARLSQLLCSPRAPQAPCL